MKSREFISLTSVQVTKSFAWKPAQTTSQVLMKPVRQNLIWSPFQRPKLTLMKLPQFPSALTLTPSG